MNAAKVRIGIIGVGAMGGHHARVILEGRTPELELVAICDHHAAVQERFPNVPFYADAEDLIARGDVDAVLIATQHYSHPVLGARALAAGVHVLVEKPVAVHKADAERLIAAHTNPNLVFAVMFNQRTDPRYRLLKAWIDQGELGTIHRVSWNITDWYRPNAYYAAGGWRATWAGEGGGVLLNQSPHQLDLFQWLFGMPHEVRAFCQYGRFHDIEVEDAVTAVMTYDHGCTATFTTTTGEAPGVNRLEVAADRGLVVIDAEGVRFTRNKEPVSSHLGTAAGPFDRPEMEVEHVPHNGTGEQHVGIMNNFAAAILRGEPLIAAGADGLHSVELANAMLFSSDLGASIRLPLDGAAYEAWLMERVRTSRYSGPGGSSGSGPVDLTKSF